MTKLFAELGAALFKAQRRLPADPEVRFRKGDNAPMALVELLDRLQPEEKAETKEAKAS